MGNIGNFQNYCNCSQQNIIVTSDFLINIQDSKSKFNNQIKTDDVKQNEQLITNPKKIIKILKIESNKSLTPVLKKIEFDWIKLPKYSRAKTLFDKNSHVLSKNISRRNLLLRKLTEKNKDENSEMIIDKPIETIDEYSKPKKIMNKKKSHEDNYKDLCVFTAGEMSKDEEKFLLNLFYKHPIFMEYKIDFLKKIIDNLSILEIEEKTCIFQKNEFGSMFFIIKSGEVVLKNKKNENELILNKGETFGELALFCFNCKRIYDAYSISKIELYIITYETFQSLLNSYKDNLYDNPTFNTEDIIHDNLNLLKNYYLFKNLENEQLINLFSLTKTFHFTKNGLVLLSSTYNSKTSSSFSNMKPFFKNNKDILFVINGELSEIFKVGDNKLKIGKGECAGIIFTFFKNNDRQVIEIRNKSEDTIVLLFSEKAFIESIGINYRYEILFSLFFGNICNLDIISLFMGDSTIENYKKLFNGFNINEYKKDEIVISKSNYENKKICIVLYGELIKNNKVILSKGEMIGENLINSLKE